MNSISALANVHLTGQFGDCEDKNENLYKIEKLGFREKLWLYKSYLWYSFLTQDFKSCYKFRFFLNHSSWPSI